MADQEVKKKKFNFPPISSLTEVVLLCTSVLVLLIYPVTIFLNLLLQPFETAIIDISGLATRSSIVFAVILAIVFVTSSNIRKSIKNKSLLSQCKCLSLFGYGGVAVCGITSRICVFFPSSSNINGYIAFISYATSIVIYCVILQPNSKHYKVDYSLEGTSSSIWEHVALHAVVLVVQVLIVINKSTYYYNSDKFSIIGCQILYSFICAPSIFDFCQVLKGGVKLRNNDENENGDVQNQEHEAGKDENVEAAEIPENNSKVECKICTMEYSETRIPRILKECGHTICEACANELLKKNNQRHLCCPFCQEVTLVKGSADLLPKNYVVVEVVEQMKSENKF